MDSLAKLDPATREALSHIFTAFLAFDTATRDYILGGSVDAVLDARIHLLEATLAFGNSTVPVTPQFSIDAAPAFTLDLSGLDSTYLADAALAIDVGGNDLYLNRAGGGGTYLNLNCPLLGIQLPRQAGRLLPTGYLADYGGNDQYRSGYDCGTNGGGFQGAGFLYDAAGDDYYLAGQGGVNGGGFLGGLGYLYDAGPGNDVYEADPEHTAYGYGANGAGSIGGYGMLVDDGGHDIYLAGQEGANGGGYALGVGALIDAWGDDRYQAGALGTNGAAFGGQGLLWDGGGDDSYVVTQYFGNGNGELFTYADEEETSACLYDADGHDWYDDLQGNAGWDLTIHPKGSSRGSQFDDTAGSVGTCPNEE